MPRPPSLVLFALLICLSALIQSIAAAPTTKLGPTIPDAGGVALSADGSLAFVFTCLPVQPSLYIIPLPINASSNLNPTSYWTTPWSYYEGEPLNQWTYIAATASASPQVVYILDNPSYKLISFVINTTSPVAERAPLLVWDFYGSSNQINGMYYQASSGLLFFACFDGYEVGDWFVGMLDPTAAQPALSVFYTSTLIESLSALAVTSTHLYLGATTWHTYAAAVWSVALPFPGTTTAIPNGTLPTLLYTTADSNLSSVVAGDLISPGAFVVNAAESILYITDLGNEDVQPSTTPQALFALWPLYSSSLPLTLTALYEYEGVNTEVQASFALSPDQSTLYWAATGHREGLYITSKANSSLSITSPPPHPSSSASPSSAPPSPTSASVVTSSSASSAPSLSSSSASSTSAGGPLLPVGTVAVVTSFIFSDIGDAPSCLTANANATVAFAGSDGGDIFVWSLTARLATVSPAYVDGTGEYGASFLSCQASPDGSFLYLLDTRDKQLIRYEAATPTIAPVVISSFPDEVIGSLVALTIDFASSIAYVGTRGTGNLYAVNISITGQSSSAFNAYVANSDVTAMALSSDGRTLYYGAPAPGTAAAGEIYSLPVQAGNIPDPSSPTLLYSSLHLVYPDTLLVQGSTIYVKDGGALHGESGPTSGLAQEISALSLGPTAATTSSSTLYSTTVYNLPAGLVVAADASRLYYVTNQTLNSLLLVPQLAPAVPSASASLCILLYSLPGNIDYPWSAATFVEFSYNPNLVTTSTGTAVQVTGGSGYRLFTNRFGVSSTTSLTVAPAGSLSSNNLLYLGSSFPVDGQGLTWDLGAATQLPGKGPSQLFSQIRVFNQSGIVVEGDVLRIDGLGSAFLSNVPGFSNVTIGPSNLNSLAANYAACQAPITFTNGLRAPIQPSASNGAALFYYSYTISDGVSYTVQGNFTISTTSAFGHLQDLLGNQYQIVTNVTGTRLYTFIPTGQQLMSTVSGLSEAAYAYADQRFYPYALLGAAPGVYSMNTAPFFDYDGVEFSIFPSAPENGLAPGSGVQYNATSLHFTTPEPSAVLTEGFYTNLPLIQYQQQTYTL